MALKIREEEIKLFNGAENFSILQISDVHLWWSNALPNALEKIISDTNPDLIALTGDYSDTPIGATVFRRFMEKIGKSYPVVFIGGNHDIWWGKRILRRITSVDNCTYVEEHFFTIVSPNGRNINVGSRNHLPLFEANKDDMNILLVHSPEELQPGETDNVHLVLAGHLHGGQIVFYRRNNVAYPGGFVFRHCSDRKQIGNTTLIVSRGAGDTFPIRINCPKEVVRITIS